jgi:hypothetical protein
MHADDAQGEARPGYVSGDARSVGGSQLPLPRQEPPDITKWVLLPYHFGGIFLEIAVYTDLSGANCASSRARAIRGQPEACR